MDSIHEHLNKIASFSNHLQPSQRQNVEIGAMIQILKKIDYGNFFLQEKAHLREALNTRKGDFTPLQCLLYSLNHLSDARDRNGTISDYINQIKEYIQQIIEPVEEYI